MNENQSIPPKCPRCGAELPANAPEGLCPRCVAASLAAETEARTGEAGPGGTEIVKPVPAPAPSPEEIAKLFPQLEILETLGRGGMGAVYKARQPRLNRVVALKILAADKKDGPQFAERFQREAQTLARLHHPNIVAIYDFGEVQGNFYLLMEYVDGLTLRQLFQTRKLSPEEALAIVPKICEALHYAHQQGVVHRDIKPENILLDKQGQVKIADFGIAKIVGQQAPSALTEERQVIGTPHYMAPEQVERPKTVDHRADIYSLGVVLYEMLTGELPLGKFAPPSRKVQVDVRLDEVVLHALEKEPDRRYQQAQQVKTDVEAITNGPKGGLAPVTGFSSSTPAAAMSDKTILPAFLLAFFFGVFGAHRFYVGKIWTGLLQLAAVFWCVLLIIACAYDFPQPTTGMLLGFSICGCGIMATIDWILIACRAFTDGNGRRITEWVRPAGMTPPASTGPAHYQSPPRQPPPVPPSTPPTYSAGGAGGLVPPSTAAPASVSSSCKTIAPAIALMISAGWKLFAAFVALSFQSSRRSSLPGLPGFGDFAFGLSHHWLGAASISIIAFRIVPALLIIFGAYQMLRLQSYSWSLAAAILALISGSFISIPIGLWALIVLAQPGVRGAFAGAAAAGNLPCRTNAFSWIACIIGLLALVLIGSALVGLTRGFFTDGSSMSDDSNTPGGVEIVDESITNDPSALPLEAGPSSNSVSAAARGDINAVRRNVRSGTNANFIASFRVLPGGTFTLKDDRGDIHLASWESNVVAVRVSRRVTRASSSTAARVIQEHQIEFHQTGNEISVTARTPASLNHFSLFSFFTRPNLDVHYDINVPRQYEVALQSVGGNVTVAHVRGHVNAKTIGGNVTIDDIDGNAEGKTTGGSIHAGGCKGELLADTTGGSITVENFSGPSLRAGTTGGNVSAAFTVAPTADCDLHTIGGTVRARLPASAAITIDADTTGGSVDTELPVQIEGKHHNNWLHGTMNGGGPTLRLHTIGGDVKISKS